MEWVDTHAHIFVEAFSGDQEKVLERAAEAGITHIYMPNLEASSIPAMLSLEGKQPVSCLATLGLHPCYVADNVEAQLKVLDSWLQKRSFAAIGETGLDAYHSKDTLEAQKKSFHRHCAWASEHCLPLIIHSRSAIDLVLSILEGYKGKPLRGVFHCFSGEAVQVKRILDLGFYMGIGGVITYKSSGALRALLADIPLSSLVLETDSPYLAPSGANTRRNEPSFLPGIGKLLAKCKKCTLEEVARVSTQNAHTLFSSQP